MSATLELFSEFIERPQHAAKVAAERNAWPLGLLTLAVSGASLFLAQASTRHFLPVASGPASCVFVCLWAVLSGFLLTSTLNLLAEARGHSGSGVALFALVGMSELAWALVLPCGLILRAAHLDNWLTLWLLLSAAGMLAMRLKARSLRHVYGMSTARAWTVLLIPYIGIFLVMAAAGAAALLSAALSLARLLPR